MNEAFLQERFIQTSQGRIFYYINPVFEGRPWVVFLHGLSSNHTTWLKTAAALNEKKYNTLLVDLRGHGLSDKTKDKKFYNFEFFSRDLEQIVSREKISKFFLVGYSFGGTICIDYGTRHSNSILGLVLISTNYINPLRYRGLGFLAPLGAGLLNFFAFIFLWQKRKHYYYYEQGKSKGYFHSVWEGLNTMPVSINFWMLALFGRLDFKNTIQQITAPVLIVRAKADPFLSQREAAEMAKNMPRAKILAPKSSGHFLASGAQQETGRIILDFILEYENSNF